MPETVIKAPPTRYQGRIVKGSTRVLGSGPVPGRKALQTALRDGIPGSKVWERISRLALGKRIKRLGPTGKLVWYSPTWSDELWALSMCADRTLPGLRSVEMVGDPDQPVTVKMVDDREIARRLLLMLHRVDPVPIVDMAPASGHSTAVPALSTPDVAAGAAASSDDAFPMPKKVTRDWDRDPIQPGERAQVGDFEIRASAGRETAGGEPGPVKLTIHSHGGRVVCLAPGDWLMAIEWCRRRSGDPTAEPVLAGRRDPRFDPAAQLDHIPRRGETNGGDSFSAAGAVRSARIVP